MISSGLLVTCWHCVSAPLEPEQHFAAARVGPDGNCHVKYLENVAQDTNGTDLATAEIDLQPERGFAEIPDRASEGG